MRCIEIKGDNKNGESKLGLIETWDVLKLDPCCGSGTTLRD